MAFGHRRGQSHFVDRLRRHVQVLGAVGTRSTLVVDAVVVTFAQERVPRRTHVSQA